MQEIDKVDIIDEKVQVLTSNLTIKEISIQKCYNLGY